jgi:hypothetical protein
MAARSSYHDGCRIAELATRSLSNNLHARRLADHFDTTAAGSKALRPRPVGVAK